MKTIPEESFLQAANTLAEIVTNEDLERGTLYPPLNDIQKCSIKIAVQLMDYAYSNGTFRTSQFTSSVFFFKLGL